MIPQTPTSFVPKWERLKPALIVFGALVVVVLGLRYAPAWVRADATADAPTRGICRRLFLMCGGISALILTASLAFKTFCLNALRIKQILILGILATGVMEMLLLPPFQGPDEIAHWFTAIKYNRPEGGQQELLLFNLPHLTHAQHVAAKTGVRMNPEHLRFPSKEPGAPEYVSYANRFSYPFVTLVSMFYPRVQTSQEAIFFYYLCRLLPLLSLVALLWWMNRRFELPYLFIVFMSMPLVLQQFTVVTTDTIVNFGTMLVALMYLRLWKQPSLPLAALMLAVCLVITANKPVVFGLAAAVLFFVPYERLPYRRVVLSLAALAVLVVFCFSARYIGTQITGSQEPPAAHLRIAELQTPQGRWEFWSDYAVTMVEFMNVRAWVGPLAWLKTNVSELNYSLLRYGLQLALLLDLALAALRLEEIKRNLRAAGWTLAMCLWFAFSLSLSLSVIMFIANNTEGMGVVWGIQVRYFFPAVLFGVTVPLIACPSIPTEGVPSEALSSRRKLLMSHVLNAVAAGFLPMIFFARGVELTIDLLIKYW